MANPGGGFRGSLPTKYTHRRNERTHKSIHLKRQMKAVQGISQSYSHLGSDFFFRKFSKHWYVIYSGLESKNKQNTDNIKALQVTFLFSKFTLKPRAL